MAEATETRKKAKKPVGEIITAAYIDYVLEHGRKPSTVHKFCKDLGLKETDFYNVASSFEALERNIWSSYIERTIATVTGDKAYSDFSAREKVLSFHYTLLEVLKENRSFVLLTSGMKLRPDHTPVCLKDFGKKFSEFVSGVINEGKSSGEIAARPKIDETYPKLFWLHLVILLQYWKNDDSNGFENTDAFVEKSVNLAFDLISKGALDTAIDFIKFLYQSKVN